MLCVCAYLPLAGCPRVRMRYMNSLTAVECAWSQLNSVVPTQLHIPLGGPAVFLLTLNFVFFFKLPTDDVCRCCSRFGAQWYSAQSTGNTEVRGRGSDTIWAISALETSNIVVDFDSFFAAAAGLRIEPQECSAQSKMGREWTSSKHFKLHAQ